MYVSVFVSVSVCVCVFLSPLVCVYVCLCVCLGVWVCVYVCLCMCPCHKLLQKLKIFLLATDLIKMSSLFVTCTNYHPMLFFFC